MRGFVGNVLEKYALITKVVFFCFIFFVLSLGRGFSVMSINLGGFPFYVTELMLLISLPLIIVNRICFSRLSRVFLAPLIIFFLFGLFYLFLGVAEKNSFTLRDIVLCGYILFFALSFIFFLNRGSLRLFLVILLLSNLFAIAAGRVFIFNIYPSLIFKEIIEKGKAFNFGFTYGLLICFLIPFYFYVKRRFFKIVLLVLASINLYMLLILGVRTLWAACFVLCIFFALVLRKKVIKLGVNLIIVFLVVASVLFCLDFKLISQSDQGEFIMSKFNSLNFFIKKAVLVKTPVVAVQAKPVLNMPAAAVESVSPVLNMPAAAAESVSSFSKNEVETAPVNPSLSKINLKKVSNSSVILPANPSVGTFDNNLDNISFRFDIWRQAIRFGLKSPIFGRGFGVYPKYTVWGNYAPLPKNFGVNSGVIPTHNHLVSIFYKMGFLGLFIFLFINFYVLVYGLRYINKCGDIFNKCFLIGSLGAFVFWHTMALLFDVIDSPSTSIFLWIIIGFIFSVVAIDNEEKTN